MVALDRADEIAIIEARLDGLIAAGSLLRATAPRARAGWLAGAFERLADAQHPLGARARQELPASSGLSTEMVDWCLQNSLRPWIEGPLPALPSPPKTGCRAVPPRLVTVILSGNVFTAALSALALPLLAGAPVIAKASSRDDRFARLLHAALRDSNPELAAALAVLTFPGGTVALETPLLQAADVVSVFGSDATIRGIAARLPATSQLLSHGHGLGVALLDLTGPDAEPQRLAELLAEDIVAYDQRGCMSPLAAFVRSASTTNGAAFARMLFDALGQLARRLPRGALSTAAGALQVQWRGVAQATAELHEGDDYAVSYEGELAPRYSPGWRNIGVYECSDEQAFVERVAPLGVHLKVIGVNDPRSGSRLASALPPPLCPRVCEVGQMQRPRPDALVDGIPPFAGLLRWIQA